VPGLHVIEGTAPEVFEGLAQPDAIFIGGGARIVLDPAMRALRTGGRLVVNAVTTETEAVLLRHRATLGGELGRIAIARVEPVGGRETWRPALPVTQWVWVKP
jgi:precorrin-6Y C5,15-methyltransferase (decarboxylating)